MKIDITKLTPELITELCKDENAKQILINNGVVKNELEVGKWYKRPKYGKSLFFITKLTDLRVFAYGFDFKEKWTDECDFSDNDELTTYGLATPQEVETALTNEAVKRGFVKGVTHTIVDGTKHIISEDNRFGFDENRNSLLFNNWCIFKNGVWATIIPQEETYIKIPLSIITLTDSKKKLGKIVKTLAKNV